jgi:hypothetical protein
VTGRLWLPSRGPYSPFSVGPRSLLARTCRECGKFADADSYPILNAGTKKEARRRVCHVCHNARKKRDREERGIGQPTARPPENLQTSAYRRWSQEDDQRMRELVALGTPYESIAVTLGRSMSAVYTRRVILGIARVRTSHRVETPWRIER